MMDGNSQSVEALLASARRGEANSLAKLLDVYRNYLRFLARTQIDMRMRIRVDPSDVVQETMMEAVRDFGEFRGQSSSEFMGWLRQMLARNLADQFKSNRTQKRDLKRQQSLETALDQSSCDLAAALRSATSSPSEHVSRQEQALLLANVLARLPNDYREVIFLRQFEQLSFDEVAQRMQRKNGAVRMLFSRALDRLRQEMSATQ